MTTLTTTNDQNPALPRGRLMFALDATASRAPTWVIARDQTAKMFREAAPLGHLSMQLVYYRGSGVALGDAPGAAECRFSKWVSSGDQLVHLMNRIDCRAGITQIGRVLTHALRETEKAPVQAVVFIGDAMEEQIEELAATASKLGALETPIFLFQEGRDPAVEKAFRLLALKSGGAYFRFDPANIARAVEQLSDQLSAIARLAVGDTEALEQVGAAAVLTDQRR
jgi:hypothetical protein